MANPLPASDDIEHGILRGNRPSPASLLVLVGLSQLANGHFKATDPRAKYVRETAKSLLSFTSRPQGNSLAMGFCLKNQCAPRQDPPLV